MRYVVVPTWGSMCFSEGEIKKCWNDNWYFCRKYTGERLRKSDLKPGDSVEIQFIKNASMIIEFDPKRGE